MAIALGLFLATLTLVAPPVAAVEISQPLHTPGTVTVTLHFEDPERIPLTRVLLHFACDADGSGSFTDEHQLLDGNSTAYATLRISPLSTAGEGYGYLGAYQSGYGYANGQHGYATGETGLVQGGYGYGYGYGYGGGDLVLVIELKPEAFVALESCTLVVGIDAPGFAGDFESPPSDPFQPRIPPVADAKPGAPPNVITKPENATVTLDGSDSEDLDGKPLPLAYSWDQASGTAVTLSEGAEEWLRTFRTPAVVPLSGEDLVFTLNVTDGLDQAADQVTVHVHANNTAPVANAGANQTAVEGANVTLDGSASFDLDNDELVYSWELVEGPEGLVLTGEDTASPSFTVPGLPVADDEAVFRLNVTDTAPGSFSVDLVTVHLQKRPIAILSPNVEEGIAPLTVHFTITDSCSTPTCSALLVFGDGSQMQGPLPNTVTHVYRESKVYEAVLSVKDARNLTALDSATIDVTANPDAPVADAGPNQAVYEGQSVQLDGRGSHDPQGGALTYLWQVVNNTHNVGLSSTTSAQPTFTAPAVNNPGVINLKLRLTVTDPQGIADSDEMHVKVHDLPPAPQEETYFLHSPSCLAAGQDLALGSMPPLAERDAHASHRDDGSGTPEFFDHLCVHPVPGLLSAVPPLEATFTGQSSFPAENATLHAYGPGSRVDGSVGLSLLLGEEPLPLDAATLDVHLLDEAGNEIGHQHGIAIGYDQVAFGLPVSLLAGAPDAPGVPVPAVPEGDPQTPEVEEPGVPSVGVPALTAYYVPVSFGFPLPAGGVASGDNVTLHIEIHSETANVFVEDGHDSWFTLKQPLGGGKARPTANAGPALEIDEGSDVTLSGSAAGLAGNQAGFSWYQVEGPRVSLAGNGTATPSFEAPAVSEDTDLVFALLVTDKRFSELLTSPQAAEVTVTVADTGGDDTGGEGQVNRAPLVAAGPNVAADERTAVVLNGVALDEDGEPFTAVWTQVRAAGDPAVELTQMPNADAALVAPEVGNDRQLTFRLTATDARGKSANETMVLTVRDRNGGSSSSGSTGPGSGPGSGPGGDPGCTACPTSSGSTSPGPIVTFPPGTGSSSSSGSASGSSTGASGSLTLPPPLGGVLGYDLSHTLRVTRNGTLNQLAWDSPGFQPMGYQVWASNSPYVLLAINEGNDTTYDDATGTAATLYKVTYFTGLTEADGFFGDAAAVFGWPEAQHQAEDTKKAWGIPSAGIGLVAVALVGAALLAMRRRLQ